MAHSFLILRQISAWIAILALTLAVMLPDLNGGFIFDDNPNIVENSAIHLESLNFDSLRASISGPTAGPLGRPISVISFALTYYFFGLDPFAFKAINLAIHAINGLLVAWLVKLLLRTSPGVQFSEKTILWLPMWVAAVWLIHPINIMTVMLAVQRMALLSGMFMLLALISHLKAMSMPPGAKTYWAWFAAGWLLFWPLSILSKETGLLFPLYSLAIMLLSRPPSVITFRRPSWAIPASLLSLPIIAIAMLFILGWHWLESAYAMRPFTLTERLLTEARVLWFYAAQIVTPNYASFGLYLDDFSLSTGILKPPTTLLSVIGWGVAIPGIWIFRNRQPLLCFGVAWFLVGHSLESTFLPLEIAQEYRNYIPSIGLILAVGHLGVTTLQKLGPNSRPLTIRLLAATSILVLALFTWLRADQMGNPLLGTQMEATRHPQSARANHAAALALIKAGYGDASDPIAGNNIRFYLQQSEMADPSFKFGYLGLIIWSCGSGRPVEKQWLDGLSDRLEHTPFAPKDYALPDLLFKPLIRMPKCLSRQDATRLFVAGANNPSIRKSLRARFLEAAADYELLASADPRTAQGYLKMALALSPNDPELRRKLESFDFLPPRK
ncbi:MAG: pilus assembly protein PilF [Sulfuricella sp.]